MTKTAWMRMMAEPAALAIDSLRTDRVRSALAMSGIVIGIVTVVLVASVLANARNQVALLFRDLGTDNVFAFHLTGDPYVTPNEKRGATPAAPARLRPRDRSGWGPPSVTSAPR